MRSPVAVEVAEARCRYGIYRFPQDDEFAGRSLRVYGEWAQQELALITSLLEEEQVAIDGGAFVGTHTIPMARSVGSGGVVHAFEPNKLIYPLLADNLRNNAVSNAIAYPFALSQFSGILYQQQQPDAEEGYINFGHNQPSGAPEDLEDDVDSVTTMSVDGLRLSQCDLMKLDLEGMESNAIIGASRTIEQCHPILYVECNTIENGWLVINILRPHDYQFWLHRCDAFSPDNFNHSTVDIFDKGVETNLVCIPRTRERDIRKLLLFQEALHPIASLDDLAIGFVQSGKIKEVAFGRKA